MLLGYGYDGVLGIVDSGRIVGNASRCRSGGDSWDCSNKMLRLKEA